MVAIFAQIIIAMGRQLIFAISMAAGLFISIGVSVFAINQYGVIGAVWGFWSREATIALVLLVAVIFLLRNRKDRFSSDETTT